MYVVVVLVLERSALSKRHVRTILDVGPVVRAEQLVEPRWVLRLVVLETYHPAQSLLSTHKASLESHVRGVTNTMRVGMMPRVDSVNPVCGCCTDQPVIHASSDEPLTGAVDVAGMPVKHPFVEDSVLLHFSSLVTLQA
jgi:hypothetical protein